MKIPGRRSFTNWIVYSHQAECMRYLNSESDERSWVKKNDVRFTASFFPMCDGLFDCNEAHKLVLCARELFTSTTTSWAFLRLFLDSFYYSTHIHHFYISLTFFFLSIVSRRTNVFKILRDPRTCAFIFFSFIYEKMRGNKSENKGTLGVIVE